MDALVASTITTTARNMDAVHNTILNDHRLMSASLVLYAKRLAARYRLLSAYTWDIMARHEEVPCEITQSELADAALLFKSDNELFEHVVAPVLYWMDIEKKCKEQKLSICNYHEFTFAFELVQAVSIAIGARFYEAQEAPVPPASIVEMIAGPVIEQIIASESMAQQNLNQDIKAILCNRTVAISEKEKSAIMSGTWPETLQINYEFMRKILHKVHQLLGSDS